jgi:hypothetical protein
MKTPFTADQFTGVFNKYNMTVWPMQIVFYALAFIVIIMVIVRSQYANRVIFTILAFFWFWMGIVYHLVYFTAINKAAWLFGAIFIAQGILFLVYGFRGKLSFHFRSDLYGFSGSILILFSLVIYPLLGFSMDHIYPYSPTFGLPCPTTIFTLGLLLCADKKLPVALIVMPLIWSLIGFIAAFSLGIKEDTGLLVAGLIVLILVPLHNTKLRKNVAA